MLVNVRFTVASELPPTYTSFPCTPNSTESEEKEIFSWYVVGFETVHSMIID
jgi:hypothetical protein